MDSPSTIDESSNHISGCSEDDNMKQTRDDVLVDLVEEESVLWKRNHPNFKNQLAKEQAWLRIATKLGVSTTEVERRFKSIREKYRRRKILMERDSTNNVESTKLKRWDLFSKLSFLDDYMIPRNGTESLGMISSGRKGHEKSSAVLSSENISSTNEVSIHPLFMLSSAFTAQAARKTSPSTKSKSNNRQNGISVRAINQISSRSSLSTPSPSTTTNHHVINDSMSSTAATAASLTPIVKMETRDDDEEDEMICGGGDMSEQPHSHHFGSGGGNFNYVGDFISAELNKLPMRHAFVLKNNLIREVLSFTEGLLMEAVANLKNSQ